MKKVVIFCIVTLAIQAVFWTCRSFFVSGEEKEYRGILSDYEGMRYDVARREISKNRDSIPDRDYDRLMEQIDWMNDLEHTRVTAYLTEDEDDKGYVHVSVPPELSGAEGFSQTRAVPLLVYQEGFRDFFGVDHDYVHYIQAILAVIGMTVMYDRVKKEGVVKQLRNALWVVGVVYLPEFFWLFGVYGFSGGEYPGVSVGDIGDFSLYEIMRIVFLFRFMGVFTLGNMVMFLGRLLVKKDRLPGVVVGVVWVLPVVIGLVVVLAGGASYAICGVADLLIMTNVLAFRYEYIAILFFVNVIILAVCKFYRIYIYTEEDVARMERHFGGGLG